MDGLDWASSPMESWGKEREKAGSDTEAWMRGAGSCFGSTEAGVHFARAEMVTGWTEVTVKRYGK